MQTRTLLAVWLVLKIGRRARPLEPGASFTGTALARMLVAKRTGWILPARIQDRPSLGFSHKGIAIRRVLRRLQAGRGPDAREPIDKHGAYVSSSSTQQTRQLVGASLSTFKLSVKIGKSGHANPSIIIGMHVITCMHEQFREQARQPHWARQAARAASAARWKC